MREVTIYEPRQRAKIGFFKTIFIIFSNTIKFKHLLYQLTRRDILLNYKKSFLGISWIIISPILGVVSWVFMQYFGILNPGDTGMDYKAYILLSTNIWGIFMGLITSTSNTMIVSQSFIQQVNFPHEILIFKQVIQYLFNFIFSFLVTIGILLFFGVSFSWMIILFPFLIMPFFFIATTMGLIISIIKIVAVDIERAFLFLVSVMMYFTPVIYSPEIQNDLLQKIMKWNPLAYIINVTRDVILTGNTEYLVPYLYVFGGSFLVFLLSLRLFYIAEHKVVEKMI